MTHITKSYAKYYLDMSYTLHVRMLTECTALHLQYRTHSVVEHGQPFVACMMITNVTVKRGYKKQENVDLIPKVS